MTEHSFGFPRPDNWDQPTTIPDIPPTMRRILVAIDGSDHAELGLAHAAREATWSGAEVLVLVAFDHPVRFRRRGMLPADAFLAQLEADAVELAGEATELLLSRGLRARAIAVQGEAVEAIIETADAEDVDLVVIGRRGLGHLRELLIGSVSDRVVTRCRRPVLVVS
jgi:nucleotide-binding universal stress UspA family protein